MADLQEVVQEAPPVEVKPEVTQPVEAVKEVPVVETPKEDLISRVSKVKIDVNKPQTEQNEFGLTKEDYEKVTTDPTLSKYYKSMQSVMVKRTQEAADLRKKADETMKQASTWTEERLRRELNNPDFVKVAQVVAQQQNPSNSGLTDQEYSALTDKEKAQLQLANQRIANLEMQNWQMLQKQQDETLKSKYANYNSDYIDTTVNQLVRGEVKADREVVWKALDYDDAVRRAYELGKQDRQMEVKEKTNSMSLSSGFQATPLSEVPPIEKWENDRAYFKRLGERRLAESIQRQNR